MIKLTSTQDIAAETGVKCLVYGPSGVGKTCLCATAPLPVIVSVEAGLLSLSKVKVPAILVRSLEELNDAYSWFSNSSEAKGFDTLCLDSLSEIADVVLSSAKKTVKDPRLAYGELLDKMLILVRAFRDMPQKHVCMTAKIEWEKDDATGAFRYQPMMPGKKLGPQLPYLFDEVFRMGVNKTPQGEEYRFLQTKLDFQYEAKDRSGMLDPIEPPDLSQIINKIQGRI
jgi:hypothetical protein